MSVSSKAGFKLPETTEAHRRRASRLYAAMEKAYPDATCALNYRTPHELLIATILSAQSTDVGVNKATPALFKQFPNPSDYAASSPEDLQPWINSIGLYRNKSKAIHEAMTRIVTEYDGEVPATMEDLLSLRGVARKTANVVLGNAFGINVGVVVDTHVMRLARRFSLTEQKAVAKIERDLMALFPRPKWTQLSHLLIAHGRAVCKARHARCSDDPICQRYCQCEWCEETQKS
ncbi:MAG: endonuclease III [Phycisphaerales bacterium]|nr:endonuclease III [Phycisphaerales bacterium]